MLKGLIFLASYGYSGGGIGDFLFELEQQGFFAYLLPFLLIFAIVFGVLSQIKIFQEQKSVNGIIALVVGLLALQFDFVPIFFSELFPRFGVALAIILGILIMVGLFTDPEKPGIQYSLLGVGAVIFVIVLVNTAGALPWYSGGWWSDNWKTVAGVVVFLLAIAIIVGGSNSKPSSYNSVWNRSFGGGGKKSE